MNMASDPSHLPALVAQGLLEPTIASELRCLTSSSHWFSFPTNFLSERNIDEVTS